MSAFTLPLTDVVVPEADVQAVLDVYRSGWLTMGPRTQAFEHAFAELVGVEHAIAVSSDAAALHLALLATGAGLEDEVLLPSLTSSEAVAAVLACGASPVFCDSLDVGDHNLDPADVSRRVTPRSKVLLATHRDGYPCDVRALEAVCAEHGLLLVEDAAQAVMAELGGGRRAGSAGVAGCFSLSAIDQLCVGEGGMLVTADATLAEKARSLRSHAMTSVTWDRHRGHAESYDIVDVGFNYRIDEPRSALGLARLPRLIGELERRRAMVRAYRAGFAAMDGVIVPWGDAAVEHSSHGAFGVLLADRGTRDAVHTALGDQGIETAVAPDLTSNRGVGLPVSEEIAARQLTLPLSASYGTEQVTAVVAAVLAALV